MYTQCTKCETVFRLSAEVLRLAGGQVRCGNCGEVFNALSRLAEEPGAFATGGDESALELETRADHILESAPSARAQPEPSPPEAPPEEESESQIARLEIEDWELDPIEAEGAALEFTLPPGELDRIFVENRQTLTFLAESDDASGLTRIGAARPVGANETLGASAASETPDDSHDPDDHVDVDVDVDEESDADFADTHPPAGSLPLFTRTRRRADRGDAGDRRGGTLPSVIGRDVSERLRREVQDGIAQANRPVFPEDPPRGSPAGWIAAAIFGAVLLCAQLVHENRDWLAAREPFGEPLRALYAALGAPLTMPPNLSVYQLRQWGVTGDPGADGTLRVRASILNVAPGGQPYPALRVTLADRFGNRIGSRDFEPGEYLARPPAKFMAPGERADATLEIQDPGRNAEGFEFDVCLRGAQQRVFCANDSPAHAQ